MKGLEHYIGEVLDEKYHIEKLLGQGGMGAVYLATHLGTERPVALKIIAPEFMRNDEFIERFKREAKAAGRLRHPNVVDVTDFGFAQRGRERVAYLVMEYLDGCTLADVLAEESRLPLDWVVDILEQVCSAVDEAHQQGIVHRDLKPDNIWLEPNRRGGYTIKVLDFGVAKLAGDSVLPSLTMPLETETKTSLEPGATVASDSSQPSARRHVSHSPEITEAATLLDIPLTANDEAQTRIFDPPGIAQELNQPAPSAAEASTQLLQPTVQSVDDNTLLFNAETPRALVATRAASKGVLTQVGSLLGTPLYMSPEQCRGEELNARSDIYSLGVITFQMLAGETPFAGDLQTVMRLHQEATPPPLREKNAKVSRKVALLVERAMAKDPAMRPTSAAAYASALRANMEGVGSLLRRSFALYSEYFPLFLRISLLAHIPVILLSVLLILLDVAEAKHWLPKALEIIFTIALNLLSVVITFLANSVIAGMTVLIVMQLTLAPLRPVQIRPAFAILKKRWRAFLKTSIRVGLRVMLGFVLLLIPGIVMMIRYTLYAPIVLLEGLEKKAALKRARELVSRSRRTVVKVVCLQLIIPMIVTSAAVRLAGFSTRDEHNFAPKIYSHLLGLLNILIVPLISIMVALLYMKLRQVSGEQLRNTLEQIEVDEVPRSKWQQRMRLSLHPRSGKH
ncbi:MAG: serine/threonine protein kinase, bacterial [Acidobacteriota bacterium]|jgi:serine/threonine protein kinase|nr:serine/threonine protein kinase, bacterial [Acidobacteriota bacterium]